MKQVMKKYREGAGKMTESEREALSKEWNEVEAMNSELLPTVKDMVDHIDHVKDLVGVDYVGIGSDFDGGGGLRDCTDVSQFSNITRELLLRGYSEKEIRKIWGGNLMRVFNEVEKYALNLSNHHGKLAASHKDNH